MEERRLEWPNYPGMVQRTAGGTGDWLGGLLLLLAAAAALLGWWVFDTLEDVAPGNDPSPIASWVGAASLVLAVLMGTLGLVLVLSRGTRERLRRERQFERPDDV